VSRLGGVGATAPSLCGMGDQFDDQVLEGDGFRLSPLGPGDIQDVTSACRDEVTQRWLPLPLPYPRSRRAP
jgi:hypothetical protein